ncbi:MAG: CvpA family protein [Desulfomonile tiedjei]|uniref:CvpA family protein n=1 Tax=Desulfomonile tiedjei TaxID=2358 RepID=A0A9D6UXY5_9BACT|nr:CvpA family protein [Desulfomonile tiedjei]
MAFIESYNLIDVFILGTLLITLILGTWKGFVRSLTALASLVLGVAAAVRYYSLAQPYLSKVSSLDPQISSILSMVIIFILVQIVFLAIRWILDALLNVTKLSWLDRIFGAAMGLGAGFLIVAAAVQVILIGIPEWPLVKTSKLIGPVDQLAVKGMNYAPKQARDQVQSLIAKWKGTQEPALAAPQREAVSSQKPPGVPPGLVK